MDFVWPTLYCRLTVKKSVANQIMRMVAAEEDESVDLVGENDLC